MLDTLYSCHMRLKKLYCVDRILYNINFSNLINKIWNKYIIFKIATVWKKNIESPLPKNIEIMPGNYDRNALVTTLRARKSKFGENFPAFVVNFLEKFQPSEKLLEKYVHRKLEAITFKLREFSEYSWRV